jgi:hypothetical protein
LDGRTSLADLLTKPFSDPATVPPPIELPELCQIFLSISDFLHQVHSIPSRHFGNLKPDSIFLTTDLRNPLLVLTTPDTADIDLTDFGIFIFTLSWLRYRTATSVFIPPTPSFLPPIPLQIPFFIHTLIQKCLLGDLPNSPGSLANCASSSPSLPSETPTSPSSPL